MSGETVLTIVGNLTAPPEMRFTSNNTEVASFTIASTPRTFDRASGEWQDGTPLFLQCTAWKQLATNIVDSFDKGTRVIAQGRLKQRSWEDKQSGQKRTVLEMEVDEIGPSLRFASAKVLKVTREGSGFSGNDGRTTSKAGRGGGDDQDQPPF